MPHLATGYVERAESRWLDRLYASFTRDRLELEPHPFCPFRRSPGTAREEFARSAGDPERDLGIPAEPPPSPRARFRHTTRSVAPGSGLRSGGISTPARCAGARGDHFAIQPLRAPDDLGLLALQTGDGYPPLSLGGGA